MAGSITPRVLKGFRDFLPERETGKRYLIAQLEKVFKLFGFVPIDTPVLEYTDILLGKGGGETDKQIYRFFDNGNRDIAMRYDLTVPFARFMSQHRNELYLPFRRYHIAKVWRGENTQKGRYREFTQCDFDIVGSDSVSADFEILFLMYTSLISIGIKKFTIHVSDRNLFNRLLEKLEIKEKSAEILRTVDKVKKIGTDKVHSLLSEITGKTKADAIIRFISKGADFTGTVEAIRNSIGAEAGETTRIEEIWKFIEDLNLTESFTFDPSITRGLDYYTGIVFETYLNEMPAIGSVCSGGRYNNLTALYSREAIPGVGSSIGLDRLMAAVELLATGKQISPVPQVIILNLDESLLTYYQLIALELRNNGISTETYPDKKKLAVQFNFAGKKGIPLAVICGEDEKSQGLITLKDLRTRKSYSGLTLDTLKDTIKMLL
ncbi:MAG: histidine--tRNA ligase [Spirochaetes bacterium]|nr:histidine--tRNA ligase [Spirochaetota bacterium]